jgi:alkanesulfonate monooxygenase SsuD/methylene tetrahydromethanopterin reductase-like flavin-dependent oxidoreductase (luciferase family)
MREVFVFGDPAAARERLLEFAARGITTLVLLPVAAPERMPELIDRLAPS